ncbi:MAG: hypothetical protein AB1Z98_26290 [Nannocystaceae bacterium]
MFRNSFTAPLLLATGLLVPLGCDPVDSGDDMAQVEATDGEDGPGGLASPEARLCERIDECGYLGAGYSVGDCTDIVGACTDDLLTSAKQDWDTAAEGCLELANCQNFGSCFASIDVCIADIDIEFEVEIDDGGDGPGNPPSGDDTGGSCQEGYQACVGGDAIEACIEGELYGFTCPEVCNELGFEVSLGCAFDESSGAEVCFCE